MFLVSLAPNNSWNTRYSGSTREKISFSPQNEINKEYPELLFITKDIWQKYGCNSKRPNNIAEHYKYDEYKVGKR